jgi:uracil-DNA glycosylase family 4
MADDVDKQRKVSEFVRLNLAAQSCTSCNLAQTRTKVVFGVGNPASPLLLIGEGPGANEDAIGEPFVGRAGKLLDECLFEAGLKRAHVFITNIVKCRASIIENGRVKNRVPTTDEISTCVPQWLDQQIAVMSPVVILCVGSPAANTVIHSNFRILQERGQFQESKYCRHTMAALHPAYILRQEGDSYVRLRQTLVDDIRAAKERAIQARSEPKLTLF